MTERYAIIPLGDGQPPPDALVIGTLSDVTTYIPQSVERKELEQILEEITQTHDHAKQLAAYEQNFKSKVQAFNDKCAERLEALDARQHRLDAKRAKRKAREEQEHIQSYLDGLPDDTDDLGVHRPTGDLHTLSPPDKGHWDPEADDAGGVPLSYGNVPTSYIKGKRDEVGDLPSDIERGTPAPLGNYPVYNPAELGRAQDPKQVAQPVSIGLNSGG